MAILYLAGAVILICIAHLIRVLRWELFIDIYERPDRPRLIRGLSISYLLNYVLPFKLGDLFRAWYSGKKMKNGVSLGLSTVIVDRYLDVVCVGLIFAVMSLTDTHAEVSQKTAVFYLVIAGMALVALLAIFLFRTLVKKSIRAVASIFNEKIEAVLLQFAWALTWNFKDIFQKISKLKLIGSTILMWLGYLLSYYFFGIYLSSFGEEITWKDIFIA
ncbi:MAG: flippase-like domain-containing protein, partial [Lachnospiraceae bacterium]|nr:flippase-like domain-containing protein [Lachnospiraceae bacterium]